jgi:hypothetical protein
MEYRDIHFRLESGYKWGEGMEQNQSESFHEEIDRLFTEAGWEIKEKKFSSSCSEAWKCKSRLYLHPMDASGEVAVDLIPEVEQILSKGTTFKHYHTDDYREVFDMSDEEYVKYLDDNKENIRQDLINGFRTKRSNLYITYTFSVIEKIKEKYHIGRLRNHIGRSSDDIEWRYTESVFKELIESNVFVIAETKHGIGYRTKTDKELKAEKKTA